MSHSSIDVLLSPPGAKRADAAVGYTDGDEDRWPARWTRTSIIKPDTSQPSLRGVSSGVARVSLSKLPG